MTTTSTPLTPICDESHLGDVPGIELLRDLFNPSDMITMIRENRLDKLIAVVKSDPDKILSRFADLTTRSRKALADSDFKAVKDYGDQRSRLLTEGRKTLCLSYHTLHGREPLVIDPKWQEYDQFLRPPPSSPTKFTGSIADPFSQDIVNRFKTFYTNVNTFGGIVFGHYTTTQLKDDHCFMYAPRVKLGPDGEIVTDQEYFVKWKELFERVQKECPNWKKLLIIDITLDPRTPGGVMHAGNLIIRSVEGRYEVERFEPHGNIPTFYDQTKVDAHLRDIVTKNFPYEFTYVSVSDECPIGPQAISGDAFCAAWSLYYMFLRIANPTIKRDDIMKYLISTNVNARSDVALRLFGFIIWYNDYAERYGINLDIKVFWIIKDADPEKLRTFVDLCYINGVCPSRDEKMIPGFELATNIAQKGKMIPGFRLAIDNLNQLHSERREGIHKLATLLEAIPFLPHAFSRQILSKLTLPQVMDLLASVEKIDVAKFKKSLSPVARVVARMEHSPAKIWLNEPVSRILYERIPTGTPPTADMLLTRIPIMDSDKLPFIDTLLEKAETAFQDTGLHPRHLDTVLETLPTNRNAEEVVEIIDEIISFYQRLGLATRRLRQFASDLRVAPSTLTDYTTVVSDFDFCGTVSIDDVTRGYKNKLDELADRFPVLFLPDPEFKRVDTAIWNAILRVPGATDPATDTLSQILGTVSQLFTDMVGVTGETTPATHTLSHIFGTVSQLLTAKNYNEYLAKLVPSPTPITPTPTTPKAQSGGVRRYRFRPGFWTHGSGSGSGAS